MMKVRAALLTKVMAAGALVTLAGCGGDDSTQVTVYDAGPDSTADAQPPIDSGGNDAGIDSGDGGGKPLLPGPSHGSAIVVSPDDSVAVAVNRDVGTVTVLKLAYPGGGAPATSTVAGEVQVGAEPWQAVIGPDNDSAYVVLRKDQKVVKITGLKSTPAVSGNGASVGSEPTGIAMVPSGKKVWVTNWVDGTIAEIDTGTMTVTGVVDLNAPLVATGMLGTVKLQKVALAHPRSLAITNNGDASDSDESIFVTEFYGQATAPEAADGSNSDTRRAGIVYKVKLSDKSVSTIQLAPLTDMGFKDEKNVAAGCFPNQLQSVTINGKFAYVVSICESPKGPTGPKVTTTACTAVGDCAALNLVDPLCVAPSGSQTPVCVDVASVKTTTAPLVSVIDTTTGAEVPAARVSLNKKFLDLFVTKAVADNNARRFPLVANDMAFVPGTNVGYISANGADAVFRVVYDQNGAITEVGSSAQAFINLNPAGIDAAKAGLNPIGIAVGAKGFAFTANEATRTAMTIDLQSQSIGGTPAAPASTPLTAMPQAGSDAEKALKGKRFFNTGVGRWSLKGQGWGSCQSCHIDGLSDNVTWYFARGPRQSTSLDGTFNKKDLTDQRILNWTAINDELADFEGNTRGVSGGVGAVVSANTAPPATTDRINIAGFCASPPCANGNGNQGLSGSALKVADPGTSSGYGVNPPGLLTDWSFITKYVQTIRSPRAASGLDAAKVAAGAGLFVETAAQINGATYQPGGCYGCHGGGKWTLSKAFYNPDYTTTEALRTKSWTAAVATAGFPTSLLPMPTTSATSQNMRFAGTAAGTAPNGAQDQILCGLRPVGTFGVAEAGAGIAELRIDMATKAQGDGSNGDGNGYNVPSLLGVSVGAPYFHAANARTLEALFATAFQTHHRALGTNFLQETNHDDAIDAMIQFLLSIDGEKATINLPALGNKGGDFCSP